jgi:hypothetical protein
VVEGSWLVGKRLFKKEREREKMKDVKKELEIKTRY